MAAQPRYPSDPPTSPMVKSHTPHGPPSPLLFATSLGAPHAAVPPSVHLAHSGPCSLFARPGQPAAHRLCVEWLPLGEPVDGSIDKTTYSQPRVHVSGVERRAMADGGGICRRFRRAHQKQLGANASQVPPSLCTPVPASPWPPPPSPAGPSYNFPVGHRACVPSAHAARLVGTACNIELPPRSRGRRG